MKISQSVMEKAREMFFRLPKPEETAACAGTVFTLYDDSSLGFSFNGAPGTRFFSEASVKDGRVISTKTAKRQAFGHVLNKGCLALDVVWEENGLQLTQKITAEAGEPYFVVIAELKDLKKKQTVSNYIAPLDFAYPDALCDPLFLSLDQKMLLVPYDNDMWVRYESVPLRPGRTSYDVTAIYDENTNRGLIIGALDHYEWKNAIRCSQRDARCYTAFSGVADAGTHDIAPHGYLDGDTIRSSRFMCGMYDDIRDGLEKFGKNAMKDRPAFRWEHPVPFGWNSFSAGCMTVEQWQEAGRFISSELKNFCDPDGVTFINLDANFFLNKKKMKAVVDELHARGQKAGNYMSPLLGLEGFGFLMPLKGSVGRSYKDIIMKDEHGRLYPKIDSGRPVDITDPLAEKHVRAWLREIIDMGFDYIKIDFVSHGAVEGPRRDKTVKTGRQALKRFYDILAEETDPVKVGRDIFVDLSISPLFPGGFCHARRCCCDAFGHHEDVRYVLNALNYGWWQSGTLFCFNDPDHTVLSCSAVDGRGFTDEQSARSRYNASLISGTVMLLSDDYGPLAPGEATEKARERAKLIADRPELNEIVRIGRPFRPAYIRSDTADAYYLVHEGRHFAALFNFKGSEELVSVPAAMIEAPEKGSAVNLCDGSTFEYEGAVGLTLPPYGSAILELSK